MPCPITARAGGLGETMLRAGRFAELDSLAENLSSVAELRVEGLLMKSRTAKAAGHARRRP